ncbi:ogr/Delta-like zinc finger family protein [Pectobacterium aroidearum]
MYCACADVECGHSFVMNMTFSHTLGPSAKTHGHVIKSVIAGIAPEKRKEMTDMLNLAQEDDKKAENADESESSLVVVRRKVGEK